jgi:hypothetical protein
MMVPTVRIGVLLTIARRGRVFFGVENDGTEVGAVFLRIRETP